MRSTLPLSSLPLQGMLLIEGYYHYVLTFIVFLLLLFKTYNLAYSSNMSAQEGIILFIFAFFMQVRIRHGISANKVKFILKRHKAQQGWQCFCF